MKSAAFRQWTSQAAWQREMRGRLRKAAGRMRNVALAAAFSSWSRETVRARTQGSISQAEQLKVSRFRCRKCSCSGDQMHACVLC